jgi:predicted esterase
VLALHGYHGSARILRNQFAPLAAALPPEVELVPVDAPSLASGDFGWWHDGFRGWERSRDWVRDLAARQHFDGVLGFSQGAALAGLLVAVQESDPAGDFGFGFAVMVGGFTSFEPVHAELFSGKLTIPSLHVTGTADTIVPMRDSLLLADRFDKPVIVRHSGGHVIPNDESVLSTISRFVTTRPTVDI